MPKSDLEGLKAVLYARVSTEDKGQRTDIQKEAMEKWCNDRGVIIAAYHEDHASGTALGNRPGLASALMDINLRPDISILLAYDLSRLTRGEELPQLRKLIREGATIRTVTEIGEPGTLGNKMTTAITQVLDSEENRVRRNKIHLGMVQTKAEGKHVGRRAKFMFLEDLEDAPKNRLQKADPEKGTMPGIVESEEKIYSYARQGYTLSYVARNFLGIDPHVLVAEMKPRSAPVRKLKKASRGKDPSALTEDDYIVYYRYHGTKDRYTVYNNLLSEALGRKEGSEREGTEGTEEKTEGRLVE